MDGRETLAKLAESFSNPAVKVAAAIAVIFIVGALLILFVIPSTNSCYGSPTCFRNALKECSQKSLEFTDDIPLEGKFTYRYEIGGAQQLNKYDEVCLVRYYVSITQEDGSVRGKSGYCRLRQYRELDMQFDWENLLDRDAIGECLRLERKLNGVGA